MSHPEHDPAQFPAADPAQALSGVPKTIYQALLAEPRATAAALALAAGIGRSTAGKVLVAMEAQGLVRREVGGNEDGRRMPDRWSTRTAAEVIAPEGTFSGLGRDDGTAARTDPPAAGPDDAEKPEAEQSATPAGVDTPEPMRDSPADPGPGSVPEGATDGEPLTGDGTAPLLASGPVVTPGEPCPTCGYRVRPVAQRAVSGVGTRLGQGQLHELALEHLRAYPEREWTATGIAKVIGRSSGAIANAMVTMVNRGEAEMTCAAPRRYRALAVETGPGGQ